MLNLIVAKLVLELFELLRLWPGNALLHTPTHRLKSNALKDKVPLSCVLPLLLSLLRSSNTCLNKEQMTNFMIELT